MGRWALSCVVTSLGKAMKTKTMDASTLHLLHRAGQRADENFTALSGQSDLTPRQYAVLRAVASTEEPSQTAIVRETGIDRSTLAEMIRRMIAKGLLTRRRTRRDARAYAVKLTPAGEAALQAIEPVVQRADEELLSPLTERERRAFIEALSRILQATPEQP